MGTATWETGMNQDNFIRDNNFNYIDYAAYASGVNNQEYNDNCFNNSSTFDIELYGQNTSIYPEQGDEINAANNCFYGTAVPMKTHVNSTQFEYFIKYGTLFQDCKHPGNSGNFLLNDNFNSNQPLFDCGSNAYARFTTNSSEKDLPSQLNDKEKLEKEINKQIIAIQKDTKLDKRESKKLLAQSNRFLKKLVHSIIIQKLDKEGREAAIDYSLLNPEFDIKIVGYALAAEGGDYIRAKDILKKIVPIKKHEIEFNEAQELYLDYLSDKKNFKLTSSKKSRLLEIANGENELSGFARSIYYMLTGEKIKIKFEHETETELRSGKSIIASPEITIYPNPLVSEYLNIEVNKSIDGNNYNAELIDHSGRKLQKRDLKHGLNNIQLSAPGFYFINIYENGKMIRQEKVIKI